MTQNIDPEFIHDTDINLMYQNPIYYAASSTQFIEKDAPLLLAYDVTAFFEPRATGTKESPHYTLYMTSRGTFRVLVNGSVHPLLVGFHSVDEAAAGLKKLTGKEVTAPYKAPPSFIDDRCHCSI